MYKKIPQILSSKKGNKLKITKEENKLHDDRIETTYIFNMKTFNQFTGEADKDYSLRIPEKELTEEKKILEEKISSFEKRLSDLNELLAEIAKV